MSQTAARRPGRPAAASRQDAVAMARRRFLAGERVDMQAIARELGLARATMHRWFGTREQLIGEVLADLGEQRLRALRAQTPGSGARALLAGFDAFNREVATAPGLQPDRARAGACASHPDRRRWPRAAAADRDRARADRG